MNLVKWEGISEYASGLFNAGGDNNIKWAGAAWKAISNKGLASYSNEKERHIVIIRLMTLATIYNEFHDLVFDDCFCRDDIYDWIYDSEILNFHRIRVWQLVGKDFYCDEDLKKSVINQFDEYNEMDLLIEDVNELIDEQREKVYLALVKHYTDDIELFISLLSTTYSEFDKEFIDIENLSEAEESGLYWICQRMPRSPRENI